MKLPRRLLSAALALLVFAPAIGATEAGPRARQAPQLDTAHARVIVKYRATSTLMRASSAAPAAAVPRHADTLGKRLGLVLVDGHVLGTRTQALRARGIGSAALAQRLAAQPDVEWAVPDRRRTVSAVVPNDPRYAGNQTIITPVAGQWYLRAPDATLVSAIDAVGAWSRTLGSPTVTVAVLDTGVRFDHPDLAGKLHPGYDFVDEDPDGSFYSANDGDGRDDDPSDPGDWDAACDSPTSSWHGTQTAGLVGAATDNAIGMAGSGRNVMVLPVRVLGRCGGYDSDIIAGMRWAAGVSADPVANPHPAKVINMSLGSPGACDANYVDVFAELVAAGVSVVVSSGNEGAAVGAPANCPGAIAVAGVRHAGTKVGYSNVGAENFIAAPAGNCVNETGLCVYPLLTTINSGATTPAGNTYSDGDNFSVGTSFASPLVAGVIGLMLSHDPTLSPARIRDVLKATARPFPTSTTVAACRPTSATLQDSECYCTTGSCGAGLLDARAAVNAVGAGGVMPPLISIAAATTTPVRNSSVALDGSGTRADGGRTITGYRWSVVGGSEVGQITGASGAATTFLLLNRAGDVTVQLVATDSGGNESTGRITLYAQEAPADGGGGAMSTLWNALVGLAVLVLAWQRRHPAHS